MKKCITLIILLIPLLLSCTNADFQSSSIEKSEILWDTWGVPHIYATDEADLYYGMGWAQMQAHGDLMMKLYIEARGDAPKYLGESALELTKNLLTLGIPAKGKSHYTTLTDNEKTTLDSFVAGINDYAAANPNHINEKLKGVLPITPTDVYAHSLRNFYVEFIANSELGTAAAAEIGSNTWAVSPERSESGNALLLANPHLPYGDLWLFFEAHLITDTQDIYGATLVGMPTMGIAFNKHLGWSHTVNTIDAADLFRLNLKDDGYIYDGEVLEFEKQMLSIQILLEDGTLKNEPFEVWNSVHGPVVETGTSEAIAIRLARFDDPGHMLGHWKDMGESKSLAEFEAVLEKNDLPMFNVMYADKAGNIFHHFAGYVPERPEGSWDSWEFYSGIIPGDTSLYLWDTYHDYADLPKLLNPKSGWLQNANDPPYTNTIPTELDPNDFPGYMSPTEMEFRPQRSAHLMMADDKVSFDEMVTYKHNTTMEIADRLMDDLLALESGNLSENQKEAFALLKRWDHQANEDAEGALLFTSWLLKISQGNPYGNGYFAKDWSWEQADVTPDGIKSPSDALAALELAATEIKAGYGKLNVKWGDVNRIKVGDKDIPGHGGPGWLGEFRTVYYAPEGEPGTPESLTNRAVAGDTYVAVIEFGEKPRAKVLLTYGNATQPGNPHIGDQLELFRKKEMRDAWLDRATIEANLESREEILQ